MIWIYLNSLIQLVMQFIRIKNKKKLWISIVVLISFTIGLFIGKSPCRETFSDKMIDSLNVEISCLRQAVNAKDSLLNIKLESRDSALQAISYKKKIKPETIRDTVILYKEIIKEQDEVIKQDSTIIRDFECVIDLKDKIIFNQEAIIQNQSGIIVKQDKQIKKLKKVNKALIGISVLEALGILILAI